MASEAANGKQKTMVISDFWYFTAAVHCGPEAFASINWQYWHEG
jgi:hypothetical protein